MKRTLLPLILALPLCAAPTMLCTVAPPVPDWAQPGSATHTQVPPPQDFHRASRNFDMPIGVFEGQSDVGAAVVPGSATYDASAAAYTIISAGYNIWYTRDEFRYIWKKMSGDVSLAADIRFPNPEGYGDRKAVLIFRQDLEDDSKEAMTALHGAGLIHLAQRPQKGANITEAFRIKGPAAPSGAGPSVERIGIEKNGDVFTLFVSLQGEPLHRVGPPMNMHLDGPFYVGIAFCSHLPATSDSAVLSHVVLENSAGMVH